MLDVLPFDIWVSQLGSALAPPAFVKEPAGFKELADGSKQWTYVDVAAVVRAAGSGVDLELTILKTRESKGLRVGRTRDGVLKAAQAIGSTVSTNRLPDERGSIL